MKQDKITKFFLGLTILALGACSGGKSTDNPQPEDLALQALSPDLAVYEPGATVMAITNNDCSDCAILVDGSQIPVVEYAASALPSIGVKTATTDNKFPVFQMPGESCEGTADDPCRISISVLQNGTRTNAFTVSIKKNKGDPVCSEGSTVVNGICVSITCPPGFILENDKCILEPEPGCQQDSDCGKDFTCVNGECVPAPKVGCNNDTDCAEGQICVEGTCQSTPPPPEDLECKIDEDCPSDAKCVENKCQVKETDHLCTLDAQCKEGEKCHDGVCTMVVGGDEVPGKGGNGGGGAKGGIPMDIGTFKGNPKGDFTGFHKDNVAIQVDGKKGKIDSITSDKGTKLTQMYADSKKDQDNASGAVGSVAGSNSDTEWPCIQYQILTIGGECVPKSKCIASAGGKAVVRLDDKNHPYCVCPEPLYENETQQGTLECTAELSDGQAKKRVNKAVGGDPAQSLYMNFIINKNKSKAGYSAKLGGQAIDKGTAWNAKDADATIISVNPNNDAKSDNEYIVLNETGGVQKTEDEKIYAPQFIRSFALYRQYDANFTPEESCINKWDDKTKTTISTCTEDTETINHVDRMCFAFGYNADPDCQTDACGFVYKGLPLGCEDDSSFANMGVTQSVSKGYIPVELEYIKDKSGQIVDVRINYLDNTKKLVCLQGGGKDSSDEASTQYCNKNYNWTNFPNWPQTVSTYTAPANQMIVGFKYKNRAAKDSYGDTIIQLIELSPIFGNISKEVTDKNKPEENKPKQPAQPAQPAKLQLGSQLHYAKQLGGNGGTLYANSECAEGNIVASIFFDTEGGYIKNPKMNCMKLSAAINGEIKAVTSVAAKMLALNKGTNVLIEMQLNGKYINSKGLTAKTWTGFPNGPGYGKAQWETSSCPAGSVMTGMTKRHGGLWDAITPLCRMVEYK